MELILWVVLGIIMVILTIIFLVYLTTSKTITKIFQRNNNINYKNSFTYEHIIDGLGGWQNIESEHNQRVKVLSINLVNQKYLKKIGVKFEIQDNLLSLFVNGFNMDLFFKRLKNDLNKGKD